MRTYGIIAFWGCFKYAKINKLLIMNQETKILESNNTMNQIDTKSRTFQLRVAVAIIAIIVFIVSFKHIRKTYVMLKVINWHWLIKLINNRYTLKHRPAFEAHRSFIKNWSNTYLQCACILFLIWNAHITTRLPE